MIAHFNPYQFASAFLSGVFLAGLFLISRNLWLCVFAHSLHNFLPFFFGKILDLNIPGFVNPDFQPVQGEFQPFWLDIMGVVMLAIGVYYLLSVDSVSNIEQK